VFAALGFCAANENVGAGGWSSFFDSSFAAPPRADPPAAGNENAGFSFSFGGVNDAEAAAPKGEATDAAAVPKGEVAGAPPNEKPPVAAAGAAAGVSDAAAAVTSSAGFVFASSFAAGAPPNENFAGAGADPPNPNEGVAGAAATAAALEDAAAFPNESTPPAGERLAGAAPNGDAANAADAGGAAGDGAPPPAFSRSSFSASCALAYPALAFARNAAPNPPVAAAGFGGSVSVSAFATGGGTAANASGASSAGASPASASSSSAALGFCFFTVLVTLGPEMRESTALTTAFSSAGSRSLGAARRLPPTGDAIARPSSEPASEPADEKGVWNAETADPGVPGVPGVFPGDIPRGVPGDSPPPPGVWNAGMRRTGEKDARDVPGDEPRDEASFLSRAASSSSRAVCESITARRRRSSRSVSSRAVPSMPVGGLAFEPGTPVRCPAFLPPALALASVPRTPPRAPPNARESGSLCAPKPCAPAADLSSDAGMALAESAS
jgi:hypothetical protein